MVCHSVNLPSKWVVGNNHLYLDTAALDELERKLTSAERDFTESDIERRIEEMRVARVTQVIMLRCLIFQLYIHFYCV